MSDKDIEDAVLAQMKMTPQLAETQRGGKINWGAMGKMAGTHAAAPLAFGVLSTLGANVVDKIFGKGVEGGRRKTRLGQPGLKQTELICLS